jgi:hypothetical protein
MSGFDKQIFGADKQVPRRWQSDKEAFGLTQCSAELGRTTSHSALLTCPGVNGWGLFRRLDAASPV